MALPVLSVSPVRLRHIRQAGNLVTNLGFETNTTGWSTTTPPWFLNSGATLTRVTAQFRSGIAGGQIVSTAASASQGASFSLGVLPTGTYAFGAFLKGNAGGETVQLFGGHGSPADEYVNATLTTSWQPFASTFIADGTGICYVGVRTASAAVRTLFIDDVRVMAGQTVSDASLTTVLGATLSPQPPAGINGEPGWQNASIEVTLNDEGSATVTLPNTTGDDGILHRRRFGIFTDPDYHPGDEWIEVLQDGRVPFVGTITKGEKRRADIKLTLADGLWMFNTQRETAAGFWAHAPRDVFEHYTKAWREIVVDDFDNGADPLKWATDGTNGPGYVRLAAIGVGATGEITAQTTAWAPILAVERSWRLETSCDLALINDARLLFNVAIGGGGTGFAELQLEGANAEIHVSASGGPLDVQIVPFTASPFGALTHLAIEARDRWLLFYIDGRLIYSLESPFSSAPGYFVPGLVLERMAVDSTIDVYSILLRACVPYLMRGVAKGDYRLPGTLPAGGLRATYYDEADLRYLGESDEYYRRCLAPTRQPYARRQDATINFTAVTPPVWHPPSPPDGEYFTARWTGAIYLDLAAADVTLRLTQLDNSARLWVGKTLFGQQIIDQWVLAGGTPYTLTTGSMRTHLGGSVSGWYPIRIDYAQGTGAGGIVFQRSVGGGAYAVVPSTVLSPYGIYEAEVRYDSHAEQLKAIALAFGLQYRCEPRTLESGLFPGEVVPKVRVGRDTDKTLTPDESTEASAEIDAAEVADTIFADAAGLGDQANAAQLTSEAINYPGVRPSAAADRHIMILSAYESLSDITDPGLLQTRLASMLGLRLTPWEEISARPRGHRELRDTFPLTGSIAAFAWEPGDGLRVKDEDLDLDDLAPRQIVAVTWPAVPDGLGAPSVRFRQRPRGQQDALRALVRAVLLPQRNYQGQLVTTQGNWSSMDSGYTSVMLPANLADVIRCDLVVAIKSDASSWDVQHDATFAVLASFTTTGRVDMLPFLARSTTSYANVSQAFSVKVIGGSGTCYAALELVVRI